MKILPDIHLGKKTETPETKNRIDDEPLQLDLGLKESPLNRLFAARRKLDKLEDRLKVSQFWRNPLLWITILFPLSMTILFSKYYWSIQSSLPDDIPLVAFHTNISEIFLPKILLFLVPLIIFAFSIVVAGLFRISYRRMEKFAFMIMLLYITLTILSYYTVFKVVRIYI